LPVSKRILISPGDASFNIGDEAILTGTVSLIRRFVPDAEVCVFANRPERIRDILGVEAIDKGKGVLRVFRSLPTAIRETRRADLLVWGGGQLLQDISSRLYIPFHISRLALAVALHKPTIVHSIGAGPIRSLSGKLLTRLFLNRASVITVRDEDSREVIAACGVERERILKVPDPALILRPDDSFDAKRCLSELGLDLTRPVIGIAVRRLFHRKHGLLPIRFRVKFGLISSTQRSRFRSFKAELANFIDYVVSRYGFQVLFIPMYSEAGQDDQGVGREIAQLASSKEDIFHLPVGYNSRQILSVMREMFAMLAVRMHAAVLSAVGGVPLLSIHYASKGKSFMSDAGLANYTLPAEDMGCDILVRKFNELIENYDDIKSVLSDTVRASSRDLLVSGQRIRELLGMEPLNETEVAEFLSFVEARDNAQALNIGRVKRVGATARYSAQRQND